MGTLIVLVIGATGKQESTTVNALLNCGFHVHALTVNVHLPAILHLAYKGFEVVQDNLSNKATLILAHEGQCHLLHD